MGPPTRHAVTLAGILGRAPRVCFVATACQEDLRWVSGDVDVSRLIDEQTVGVSTLGVYAALGGENGVIKIALQ